MIEFEYVGESAAYAVRCAPVVGTVHGGKVRPERVTVSTGAGLRVAVTGPRVDPGGVLIRDGVVAYVAASPDRGSGELPLWCAPLWLDGILTDARKRGIA